MSLLFRWQGTTLSNGDTGVQPQTGYGDFSAARSGYADLVSYAQIANMTMTNRVLTGVQFRNTNSVAYWRVEPDLYPSEVASPVTGPFSIRLYYRRSANHVTQQPIIRVREGNTTRMLFASNQNNAYVVPGLTGAATALSPTTSIYRMEIQVDPDRSPKLVWRIYLEDETTALRNRTANPSSTVWDNILIGHTGAMLSAPLLDYGDIEIHDDYDLGGQFTDNPASPTAASVTAVGAPSSNVVVDSRFNYNSTTKQTDPVNASPDMISFTDVHYTTAESYGRAFSLYTPNGDPPEGGWPLLLWAHSGFFIQGSKYDLPANWRDDLINAGYAVATVTYVKAVIAPGAYPSYGPNSEGGRYPSFILDYKRCAAHIRDNAATYGINPDKMFATGYSAGGYIALGAALTRDLAADAASNPMSLAAAAGASLAWADGYTGADPEFKGAFVYAAPVDMDEACAFDPTYPNAGNVMHIAHRAFQGLTTSTASAPAAPHTALQSLIAQNAANIDLPVAYVRGTADYLVHWAHQELLADAMEGTDAEYTELLTPNNHSAANKVYDIATLTDWLEGVLAEPAVGPTLTYFDGTTHHPVSLSHFDGATEVPVALEGG